jgi:hypothetical protein
VYTGFKASRKTGEKTSGLLPKSETAHSGRRLRIRVCGACGYTETYIDSPEAFYQEYTKLEEILRKGGTRKY